MFEKKENGNFGFTLTEILVVFGIIVVLAGLATAVLLKVKGSAKSVLCLSNLKQIATAIQMYQADWKEIPSGISVDGDAKKSVLLSYVSDVRIFKCPADRTTDSDSYGPFYIPRPLTDSQKLFLGCPRHNDKAVAVFGWPQFNIGKAGKVLWNGSPQNQGTVVQGGTLLFEDGTQVVIDGTTKVGIMLSCTDPNKKFYSTICVQEEDQGKLTITHQGDSQFEVLTPSLITGVAGTAFTITTRWPADDSLPCSTTVNCTVGQVDLENRTTNAIKTLSAGQPPVTVESFKPARSPISVSTTTTSNRVKPPTIPRKK